MNENPIIKYNVKEVPWNTLALNIVNDICQGDYQSLIPEQL